MYELAGKSIVVTGAASGIGRAVALELAREGAQLTLSDLVDARVHAVADEARELGADVRAVSGDVSDESHVVATVELALSSFGSLYGAVNNAGITGPVAPVAEVAVADYLRVIDVNLHSVFYGMRHQLPAILESGGGSIVNVSSALGLVGEGLAPAYTAAKHGVTGLSKSAALAYSAFGVRVNSVHPGYIETPLLDTFPAEALEHLAQLHATGRLGTAEEVANTILFLLSPRASFVTGSQATVDGGYLAR